jgi:signal transduction histidine kinase
VINNLLENAITYSSSGGKVRLSLRDQGDTISLDVKDSGEGIAEDDLPHLFDRFFRVDQSRTDSESHSGLGLAICKAIVEDHGGEIGVGSTLGDGSVFTVSIPVSRS